MSLFHEWVRLETRRQFFSRGANAVGAAALAALAGQDWVSQAVGGEAEKPAPAAAARNWSSPPAKTCASPALKRSDSRVTMAA